MIFNVPQSMRSDQALTNWVNSLGLKYPAQQVCIGTQNTELAKYVEEHEDAVRKLEIILSNHLKGTYLFLLYLMTLSLFRVIYRRSCDRG